MPLIQELREAAPQTATAAISEAFSLVAALRMAYKNRNDRSFEASLSSLADKLEAVEAALDKVKTTNKLL